jgi:hypothetical protein
MAKGKSISMKDSYAIGCGFKAAGQTFALTDNWRTIFEILHLEILGMVKDYALPHFCPRFKAFPPDNLPVSLV